ncbi:uncharacterized protein TNCV_1048161 [Trichonephila clavipes]|nr:uncharacterized protein TNCV_1048161 [Trichonephila clavipes]
MPIILVSISVERQISLAAAEISSCLIGDSSVLVLISEPSDTRVQGHEEHPEQAGRVHGVFVPRLHLRPQSLSAHQPAFGKGCHQEEAQAAAPFQVQQQQKVPEPLGYL